MNARGYTMMAVAFALLLLLGQRLVERAGLADWVYFAVITALGFWTIPSMLYPLAAWDCGCY